MHPYPAHTFASLRFILKNAFYTLLTFIGDWWFAHVQSRRKRLASWLVEDYEPFEWHSSKDIAEQQTQQMNALILSAKEHYGRYEQAFKVKHLPTKTFLDAYNMAAKQGIDPGERTSAALQCLPPSTSRPHTQRPTSCKSRHTSEPLPVVNVPGWPPPTRA